MKFTEAALEAAIIELFCEENYSYRQGESIHKEISDVLLREDIKLFLKARHSAQVEMHRLELFLI